MKEYLDKLTPQLQQFCSLNEKADQPREKYRGPHLLVKASVNRFVSRRIETTRKKVKANTQKLRKRTLKNLEEIFRAAARVARGEVKHQRSDGKMVPISLKQKRKWVRVAACVAQTMNKIASNIDEQEINAQLNELERLVKEDSQKTKYP
jgi:hypothetical protein